METGRQKNAKTMQVSVAYCNVALTDQTNAYIHTDFNETYFFRHAQTNSYPSDRENANT